MEKSSDSGEARSTNRIFCWFGSMEREERGQACLHFIFPQDTWKDGIVVNWIGEGCEQSRIWEKNRILVWEMFQKSGRELIYKVDVQGRGVGWRYKLGNYSHLGNI